MIAASRARIRAFRNDFLARTGQQVWYPWDLIFARHTRAELPEDAFPGKSMTSEVRSALRAWGFGEPLLRFRVVRHDLPFGGLTIVPHVPDDVRVLVHPHGGWEYYSVLFHEFGHAVHGRSTRAPSHLLRNGLGFAAFHEGVAEVFEEISVSRSWLRTRPGLTPDRIRKFRASRTDENLLRAVLMGFAFLQEVATYDHPERDPRPAIHDRVRRLFGFEPYRSPSWVDVFSVTHPVYRQSYFVALLFSAQLLAELHRAVKGPFWPNPRVGAWLTAHWLRPGASQDWTDMVTKVTGRPLGVESFLGGLQPPKA